MRYFSILVTSILMFVDTPSVAAPDDPTSLADAKRQNEAAADLLLAADAPKAPEAAASADTGEPKTRQIILGASSSSVARATRTALNVNFLVGSAILTDNARTALDAFLQRLGGHVVGMPLTIAGHTDRSGPAAANLALTRERAASVATYLKTNGLKANSLSVAGYGFSQPLPRVDPASPLNRRVELVIGS